jgi:hypothetical protein
MADGQPITSAPADTYPALSTLWLRLDGIVVLSESGNAREILLRELIRLAGLVAAPTDIPN